MTAGRARTILVTGGAGFIGASLVRALESRGDRVRVLDSGRAAGFAYLDGTGVERIKGDLTDPTVVGPAIVGCQAVVHLAAHASVPGSIAEPRHDFEQNVLGTFNVLDAARLSGTGRVLLASSNAVTGAVTTLARPDAPLAPIAPYGAAKAAGELYAAAFGASYDLETVCLRFSNVYGPFSLHKSSVVSSFLRPALAGEPLPIHGDGEQTRDLIHVDDLVAGVLRALDVPAAQVAGRVFQLGSGRETSVNALADALERVLGMPLARRHGASRPGDVRRNVSDISGSIDRLGFQPRISLDDGLSTTVAWWQSALVDPAYAEIGATSGTD